MKSAISEFAEIYTSAWEKGTDAAQKSTQIIKNLLLSTFNENLKNRISDLTGTFYDKLAQFMEKGFISDSELAYLDQLKEQIDQIAASSQEQSKKNIVSITLILIYYK